MISSESSKESQSFVIYSKSDSSVDVLHSAEKISVGDLSSKSPMKSNREESQESNSSCNILPMNRQQSCEHHQHHYSNTCVYDSPLKGKISGNIVSNIFAVELSNMYSQKIKKKTQNKANGSSCSSVRFRSKTKSLMSMEAMKALYENRMPPEESLAFITYSKKRFQRRFTQ